MDDEVLKPDRYNGMQKVFAENYGSKKSADEEQAEQKAAEAKMDTD